MILNPLIFLQLQLDNLISSSFYMNVLWQAVQSRVDNWNEGSANVDEIADLDADSARLNLI